METTSHQVERSPVSARPGDRGRRGRVGGVGWAEADFSPEPSGSQVAAPQTNGHTVITTNRPKEKPTCPTVNPLFSFCFPKAKCGPFGRGLHPWWRGSWRPGVRAYRCRCGACAPAGLAWGLSAGTRPDRSEPQGKETRLRTARGRFEGWGEGEVPSCVLLRPPPIPASSICGAQGAAYSITRPERGAVARAEPGLPRGRRSGGKGAPRAHWQCPVHAERASWRPGHLCWRAAAAPWPGAPRATKPSRRRDWK